MKRIYKKPSAEVVNVNLLGSVLEDPSTPVGGWSNNTDEGDAKETEFEEESLINPTQPNLWEDNEEE